MRPKLVAAAAVSIGAAMFLAGAVGPLRSGRSEAQLSPAVDVVDVEGRGTLGAGTVPRLRELAARDPRDADVHAQLGLAYLRRARDQADPFSLPSAEEALRTSLELRPDENLEAFAGMAALANARHDFSESVEWSRRAIEADPYESSSYGLLGDALFELGRVRAADAAYQRMVDVRPDVASYVRVSYALQYHGRTRAALSALRLALKAAGPTGETAAWVRHQMGDVYAGLQDHSEAGRQNRVGIALAPGYVPPTVGLAETYAATGRLRQAIALMEDAVRELPALEYMVTLGDLYRATGRGGRAEAQYAAVADRLRDYRVNGVLPDADFVVFYADHGLRPRAALREARSIYVDRPTAKTADALAWMLYSLGRHRRASSYAREALAGPGPDPSILFHAGMIARSLGEDERAVRLMRRALEVDAAFSVVDAPVARRIVEAA
ncbi:MAG: hypothetical protein M3134_09445 [Actinomycetota bacterium]|nr:hypothetical protein [Actinomycetota bacterium]